MSIWGKLGAAELLVGGPIGALLVNRAALDKPEKKAEHAENDVAFTVGVIALAAKMAKADGVVTKDEVKAFKDAFKVSDAEMQQGARVFNLAKQDVTGYEACAEQLSRHCGWGDDLRCGCTDRIAHSFQVESS